MLTRPRRVVSNCSRRCYSLTRKRKSQWALSNCFSNAIDDATKLVVQNSATNLVSHPDKNYCFCCSDSNPLNKIAVVCGRFGVDYKPPEHQQQTWPVIDSFSALARDTSNAHGPGFGSKRRDGFSCLDRSLRTCERAHHLGAGAVGSDWTPNAGAALGRQDSALRNNQNNVPD